DGSAAPMSSRRLFLKASAALAAGATAAQALPEAAVAQGASDVELNHVGVAGDVALLLVVRIKLAEQLSSDFELLWGEVLFAHHQNVTLGKGAAEGSARFNVDRLGEVEPNDFRARVIRQGRDGEGHHGLLPAKGPRRSPVAARVRRAVQYALRDRSRSGRSLRGQVSIHPTMLECRLTAIRVIACLGKQPARCSTKQVACLALMERKCVLKRWCRLDSAAAELIREITQQRPWN